MNYEWKKRFTGGSAVQKLPQSRILRIIGGLVAFFALLVALIVLWFELGPAGPVDVVLIGADYATNLAVPHNVYGVEGLKGIESLSRAPKRFELFPSPSLRLTHGRYTLDRSDRWDDLIEDLRKGPKKQTLVLFVALHGGSNDAGGGYLLPNEAVRGEDGLDLRKLIDSMKRLPREKNKVLILEGAQIPADWRLGMLHNDFARRLEELEPRIAEVPNLWVLSACDVDQRCWVSEGLGRTVFYHYLLEALNNGVGSAGSSRRLNLAELHQYVRTKVQNWAWNARGALQTPVLLPRVGTDNRPIAPDRLIREASQVVLSVPARTSLARPAATAVATSLEEVWRGFNQLDNRIPHPAVYSPRRWRFDRAAIVRYDELMRAGDRWHAAKIVEHLISPLERVIREERHPTLPASAENTLAMNAVQGGSVVNPQSPPAGFTRFWNATDFELDKVWREVQASLGPLGEGRRPSALAWVDDFLLQRAEDNPVSNLERAADRIRVTKKDNHPQPAEAHFLLMLRSHLGLKDRPPKVAGLVTQALKVRRLAERSAVGVSRVEDDYHYSEQVLPWIQSLIEEADGQRRLGEDLLFSTREEDWSEAEGALSKAQARYEDAARRAGAVRTALAIRDRVLCVLPDYSHWMAHRHPSELEDGLLKTVQDLWGITHELARVLQEPSGDATVEPLERLARDVSDGIEQVETQFEGQKGINQTRMPEDWETASAAAAVAFAGHDALPLRRTIWNRLGNIGRNDVKIAASDKGETFEPSVADRQSDLDRTRRRARVEGLMALAALGQRWFDDPRFKEGDFEGAAKGIEASSEETRWWVPLAKVGAQVGRRWQVLSFEADRRDVQEDGKRGLSDLRIRLQEADRLGRRADGGVARLDELPPEAAARCRDVRVHDQLLWMARRTWLDHWSDPDPTINAFYYQVAGSKYVDDSNRLIPKSTDARDVSKLLEEQGRLEFDAPRPLVLTSEWDQPVSVSYRVVETGNVPPGIPVVSPRPGRLLQLEKDDAGQRKPLRRKGDGQPGPAIDFAFSCPLLHQAETDPRLTRPRLEESTFAVRGFFRGQVFEGQAEVRIHPLPETVVIGPAPPDSPASIAVRAQREVVDQFGVGRGSIAIVLDCSGSMGDNNQPGSKFEEAKRALVSVLRRVPRGTTVSLWTFGQAREGFVDGRARPEDRDDSAMPERTIKPLLRPVAWDEDQLRKLRPDLDRIRPYHGTPLVQAMIQAKADLTEAKALKTLLVLTDGADTRFMNEGTPRPKGMDIAKYVKEQFNQSGIMVNMVLFKADEKELVEARAQFTDVLKRLEPQGRLSTVQELGQLDQILRAMLKQELVCQIEAADGAQVGELDVTSPDEVDRWWARGLEPGAYKLKVRTNRLHEQWVDLDKGDRLIVRLVAVAGGRLTFDRALYSEDERHREQDQESGGWRLAVLQNQQKGVDPEAGIQLLATLEPLAARPGHLRQYKPRLAWFELSPEGGGGEFSVRWSERALYPAPAWQFDVPRWINDAAGARLARPVLRAWWAPDKEPSATTVLPDHVGNEVPVGDGKVVVIESILAEDHHVETRPGAPREPKPCLVVRLRYPPKSPFLVDPRRLAGVKPTPIGYEHRFYTKADRYTGLFWPVTEEQVRANLEGLSLISLSQFRTDAERDRNMIELKLSQPQPNDKQPEPPPAVPNP